MTDPQRTLEVEVKFDVEADVAVPDWSIVSAVASVTAGERRELDAVYFDTEEAELGRAGYALRRRTGGHDAGWHVKGPRLGAGREELGWPLGDGPVDDPPEAVRAAVAHIAEGALAPLARIRNERVAYEMLDPAGEVIAEFVDDHVSTKDERGGVERRWREWEVELGPAAPADHEALFEEITRIAHAAGATEATSESKLARALGV
ncbi:CYTH domain-containing protein [Microbacterium sp. SSW1-59]|uniref:CYTH domain-containing protein n=1 Tax=Microbacterium xanthum TaxID=3079794 RepID=UPI002AD28137|nr:CYTH domain-containing protein [Microbacterium sp. SSW1-59]MDZ8202672.1 CYTH domain-containing protein [Microbacterium sp. SSW1-59]